MNKERFIKICHEYDVSLAYLFGSQSNLGVEILEDRKPKVADRLSDIDVGIVFNGNIPSPAYQVYSLVYGDLQEIFSPFKLDIVFLQEVNYLLQYESIQGILVYSLSDKVKDEYEEKVLKFAADWKVEYDIYQKEVLEAIKDGYFEFEYDYAHR